MSMSALRRSVACGLLAGAGLLPAQDRSYGRSVVSTPYGIVATSYVQASQAGAEINRDEIPVALQPYVQQYFDQLRKQPVKK